MLASQIQNAVTTLVLSPAEFQIIMKAMSAYEDMGYALRSSKPNEAHTVAAEKLHDQLRDAYSK